MAGVLLQSFLIEPVLFDGMRGLVYAGTISSL